jgi:hypothetical protein
MIFGLGVDAKLAEFRFHDFSKIIASYFSKLDAAIAVILSKKLNHCDQG